MAKTVRPRTSPSRTHIAAMTEAPVPERAAAWRRLKFGLMMHWGLYSVAGGVWNGKNIEGYNEQIKHRAMIDWPEYTTLCDGFTAKQWKPDVVAKLAKEAGMQYVVMTTKHHDGFCLWHTKLSDFNAVESAPARKDVLKSLSDACAKNKIAMGVYYSLIDWHFPGAMPMSDHNCDPVTPALDAYHLGQLRELVTGYGPLCEIWFDMGAPTLEQSQSYARVVHAHQPDCMVSGRIWNGQDDYMECGDNETPDMYFEDPWESAETIFHDTWGYRSWQVRDNLEGKIREKIRSLALVTAKGGNYLLNIGPRGDGSLVEYDMEVLRGIGRWMKKNGEAIYQGEPEPHLKLSFGCATGRKGRLYLHVANPPADGVLRVDGWLAKKPVARVLGAGRKGTLACTVKSGTLSIALPTEALDPYHTIVAVDYAGDRPYLPHGTVTLDEESTVLAPEGALFWMRMQGAHYNVQRKYVVGREWMVCSPRGGAHGLRLQRPTGGSATGYRVTVGADIFQCLMPEGATACEPVNITLKARTPTRIKVQALAPRGELMDKELLVTIDRRIG